MREVDMLLHAVRLEHWLQPKYFFHEYRSEIFYADHNGTEFIFKFHIESHQYVTLDLAGFSPKNAPTTQKIDVELFIFEGADFSIPPEYQIPDEIENIVKARLTVWCITACKAARKRIRASKFTPLLRPVSISAFKDPVCLM